MVSIFGCLIIAMGILIFCIHDLGSGNARLRVFFLDVGQGDSILIETPEKQYVLVDGGPDGSVLQQLGDVLPFYARTIDLVILSHPHADHINGLVDVLKTYSIKQILITGAKFSDPAYDEFLELSRQKKIEIIIADGSFDFTLGNAVFDLLYPFSSIQGQSFSNINNSSIAFRLIYGNVFIFLAGDLETEGEEKILEKGLIVRSDVMKASHHGSRTASSEKFTAQVKPLAAIICSGEGNSFGHPHIEALHNIKKQTNKIFRTDLHGRVILSTDGKSLEITSMENQLYSSREN